MQGSMLLENQLYNVLACFKADKDEKGKYIVRGNLTSFMGAGEEFVIDATAEYRRDGQWCNLLQAVRATSYYMPIEVF
jgi:hypothetical protein